MWWVAVAVGNLGFVAWAKGDFGTACDLVKEGRMISKELGSDTLMMWDFGTLALILASQGKHEEASRRIGQALELAWKDKRQFTIAYISTYAGYVHYLRTDLVLARTALNEALDYYKKLNDLVMLGRLLEYYSWLLLDEENPRGAAQLLASSQQLRNKLGIALFPILMSKREEILEIIKSALPETEFEERWHQGEQMTVDDAIALATQGS